MMKTLLVTATLVALGAPAPALAQLPATTQPAAKDDHFTMTDANKDGALSLAEVQKFEPKVTQADFDRYDADKSKLLSKAEFQKWAEARTTAPASAPGQ